MRKENDNNSRRKLFASGADDSLYLAWSLSFKFYRTVVTYSLRDTRALARCKTSVSPSRNPRREENRRSRFPSDELPAWRTLRGVNDLIRDAGVRLRYEADLSFSGEPEREVAAAPGNTLCLPVAPHRTDILAYVLGGVTFEPVTSFNLIVRFVDV